jgi:hypothetical protein
MRLSGERCDPGALVTGSHDPDHLPRRREEREEEKTKHRVMSNFILVLGFVVLEPRERVPQPEREPPR